MVVALVVLTIAAFLIIEWYLNRRGLSVPAAPVLSKQVGPRSGLARDPTTQASLYFHPGHSWVRVSGEDEVSVGTSAFASCFAGQLAAVQLPEEGTWLEQGEPAWTLVSRKDRRLTQVMPVDGEVVEVNHALVEDPELVQRAPYDTGWIFKVRPRRLVEALHNLLHGGLAQAWDDATRLRLNQVLSPSLGARANDGGEWVRGFGDALSDADWKTLRGELFPPDNDVHAV